MCEYSLERLKSALKAAGNNETLMQLEAASPESIQREVKAKYDEDIPESTDSFTKARKQIVSEIYNDLKGKGYNLTKKTIFIGGTSYLLRDELTSKFGENNCVFLAKSLEDMQFINAEGFYQML